MIENNKYFHESSEKVNETGVQRAEHLANDEENNDESKWELVWTSLVAEINLNEAISPVWYFIKLIEYDEKQNVYACN